MRWSLLEAFQSPLLGWLTIAFFLNASVETYLKRIVQYKRTGALPAEAASGPVWTGVFSWADILLKIALVVMNWQFGLVVYVVGFALAVLGVLEHVGSILMCPFVRTALPNDVPCVSDYPESPEVQVMVLRIEKTAFIFRILLTAVAYLGLSVLLNAVRKDATAVFLWSLVILQLFLYFRIFWIAAARSSDCGYRVFWLGGILAVLGRVNDFEVFVIPAVVLASLAVSEMATPPKPPAEAEPSEIQDAL